MTPLTDIPDKSSFEMWKSLLYSVSYLLPVGAIGASPHLPIFPAAHSMTQSVLRQSSAKPEIDLDGNSLIAHCKDQRKYGLKM